MNAIITAELANGDVYGAAMGESATRAVRALAAEDPTFELIDPSAATGTSVSMSGLGDKYEQIFKHSDFIGDAPVH